MKFIAQLVHSILLIFVFTISTIAQTDSTNTKTIDLQYENTGHGVKFQHPERFYKDLILFLDRIKLQASNSHIESNN